MGNQDLVLAVLEEKTTNILQEGYIETMLFLRDCRQRYVELPEGAFENKIVDEIIAITQNNWNQYLDSCLHMFRDKNVRNGTLKKCRAYVQKISEQPRAIHLQNEVEKTLNRELTETSRSKLQLCFENIKINTTKKLNEYIPAMLSRKEKIKSWVTSITQNILSSLIFALITFIFGLIVGKI